MRRVRTACAGQIGATLRASAVVLLGALVVPPAAHAEDWAPNLTVSGTWQDNATNAKPAADRIGALQFAGDLLATERYELGRSDSVHPTLHFAGEWWPRFHGLLQGMAGARLEWRHTFGSGPLAPEFSVDAGVDEVLAKETPRRGTRVGVRAMLRKRFNDVTRVTLTQEFTDHNARAAVFDARAAESGIELARDITNVARVALRAMYREGDMLSHATGPRPDLEAVATDWAEIATYGRPLTAYSVDARTVGAGVSAIRAMDTNTALILSYEWRKTNRAPLRFINQLVSAAVVHQY